MDDSDLRIETASVVGSNFPGTFVSRRTKRFQRFRQFIVPDSVAGGYIGRCRLWVKRRTIDSAKFESDSPLRADIRRRHRAIGQGWGEIPCFQNHCPCYAARHSLFFGVGISPKLPIHNQFEPGIMPNSDVSRIPCIFPC